MFLSCSESLVKLKDASHLTAAKYDAHVTSLLQQSLALDTTHASDCLRGSGLGFYIPEENT